MEEVDNLVIVRAMRRSELGVCMAGYSRYILDMYIALVFLYVGEEDKPPRIWGHEKLRLGSPQS